MASGKIGTCGRREFIRGAAGVAAGLSVPRTGWCAEDSRLASARGLARAEIAAGHCFGVAFGRADAALEGFEGFQGATPETGRVDARTRFEIASVTKTLVTTVAGRLVAQGKLDPEAPFTRYFTDHVLAGTPHGIRVRDLAAHTSGLPWFSGRRLTPDARVHRGWAGFLDELRTCRPEQPVGTIRYNCINLCLLGEICARVGGKPLEVLAREMVFEPLGMKDTAWWPQPDDGHLAHLPLLQQDRRLRATGTVNDPPAFYAGRPTGNAGVYTTLGDLSRFALDVLTRKAFEKAYYDLVFTTLAEGQGQCRTFGWNRTASGIPAGLSPRTVYHTGFTGQTVCVDPEKGFAGVVLTVRCTDDAKLATRGREKILAALAG